jgi:hypothetical protein
MFLFDFLDSYTYQKIREKLTIENNYDLKQEILRTNSDDSLRGTILNLGEI